jgi:osmotically-inducible protein OsmY
MSKRTADERLRDRVRKELAWDVLLDDSRVDVEVVNGVVTLIGSVGSYAEKKEAESAAQSVDGVHDLISAIEVKPRAELHPSDDELKAIVEQVLQWDAVVPERHLTVAVIDGMVALTGTCTTVAQAQEAERAITHLGGVRGVINRIDIIPPLLSPAEVRKVIVDALSRRAEHLAAGIDVTVDGSIVTLSGTVSSALQRRAVVGAVGHAPGITEVRDNLHIESGN